MTNNNQHTIQRIVHPALYGLALFFSVIEFLITVILVSDYNRHDWPSHGFRDRLRFLLFTCVWTLAFTPLYIVSNLRAPGQAVSSVASNLVFTFTTWVFWLAAAAAWTDVLGGTLRCGSIFLTNQTIDISVPYCNSLRAVQAFAWMIWLSLSAVLGYVASIALMHRKRSPGLSGPMTQVSTGVWSTIRSHLPSSKELQRKACMHPVLILSITLFVPLSFSPYRMVTEQWKYYPLSSQLDQKLLYIGLCFALSKDSRTFLFGFSSYSHKTHCFPCHHTIYLTISCHSMIELIRNGKI